MGPSASLYAFFIGLVFGALVWVAARGRMARRERYERVSGGMLGAGLLGLACVAVGAASSEAPLAVAGFALAGLCGGFFEVKWSMYFLSLDRMGLYVNVLAAILFSSVFDIGIALLRSVVPFFAISVGLLLGMVAFDAAIRRGFGAELPPAVQYALAGPLSLTGHDGSQPMQHAGRFRAIVLLICASFLYSIAHLGTFTIWLSSGSAVGSYLIRNVSTIVAVAAVALVIVLWDPVGPAKLLKCIVPLAIVSMLLIPVDATPGSALSLFGLCSDKVLFDILMLILILDVVAQEPALFSVTQGGVIAAKNLGCLVGSVVVGAALANLDGDMGGFSIIVVMLVTVLLIALLWVLPEKMDDPPVPAEPAPAVPVPYAGLDEVSAALSAECGLTPREADVLPLLARGKNRASIAAELGVSSSTAHSHIMHVYQKLGVHNQQELIELFEARQR